MILMEFMSTSSIKTLFNQALGLLKQGKTLLALKKLYPLTQKQQQNKDPDYLAAVQNYILALNLIFDRNFAAAEESFLQEDEINTALILINLSNLYYELKKLDNFADINRKKKMFALIELFEKWTFKVFTTIKSTELRKKHLEKRFTEIITSFGIIYNVFFEHLVPIIEDFNHTTYDSKNLQKSSQTIYKEFGNFYLKYAENLLNQKKVIESHQIIKKCNLIQVKFDKNSKFKQSLLRISKKNAELATDFEMNTGLFCQKQEEYREALLHFRNVHNQYRMLNLTIKQHQAKTEYLNTCILSAQKDVKEAERFQKEGNYPQAVASFHQSMEKLEKINAKHDLSIVRNKYSNFQNQLGDEKFHKGQTYSRDSPDSINLALNFLEDALIFYIKADNSKRIKETEGGIQRLSKLKLKALEKNAQKAHKTKNYDLEYIILEELHLLSYEINGISKAQSYAKQNEKLRKKVNLQNIDNIREKTLNKKPWINPNDKKRDHSIIDTDQQTQKTSPQELPNIFSTDPVTTIPFFDPSKEMNNQTYFIDPTTKIPQINLTIDTKSEELKKVNRIIKKYNNSLYLTNSDIQYLISFGVNLPKDIFYYYKFKKPLHQFYVHDPPSKLPKLLMIPTRNLIKRKTYLGTLAYNIQLFIPCSDNVILSSDILNEQINFAINHPSWENIIDGFQYSTLDSFFYFLHAIRLFSHEADVKEVAKFINSSVVAEYVNTTTENLEKYLESFKNIVFFEDVFEWSQNPNFRLFFFGLFFLREKKYKIASSIFSMMLIS
jgi:hypothetical protein